jgi:hypothetical protein
MSRPGKNILIGSRANGGGLYFPYKYRQYHLHVIGQFGLGKSKFLEHLIRQDILNGEGICLIDPHGSLYHPIVKWCARHRLFDRRNILLFDPSTPDWSFGFNPLKFSSYTADDIAAAVSFMVKACAQAWGGEDMTKTPRLLRILQVVLQSLGEQGLTLRESLDLLDRGPIQKYLASRTKDELLRQEWHYLQEMPDQSYIEQIESTRNRLSAFLRSPGMRTVIGQTTHAIDFRKAMDEGAIVLVNLHLPEQETARLLGSLIVSEIYARARLREPNVSRPFHLYVDECSQFFNSDIEQIITGMRKFGLWLTLAHQNLGQLRKDGGEAVFSAVSQIPNKVIFGGLPTEDVRYLAETIYLGEIDYYKAKREQPVVTDYILATLRSQAKAQGFSTSSGRASTRGSSAGMGFLVTEDVDGHLMAQVSSDVSSESDSEGYSTNEGTFYSETFGESQTWRPVLASRVAEFVSIEEQIHEHMATLNGQPTRHAIVKLFTEPPQEIITPHIEDALITDSYVENLKQKQYELSGFALPREEAEKQVQKRRDELLRTARRKTTPQEPTSFLE